MPDILEDTGNLVVGFPVRSDMYHRSFDTSLPKEERTAAYDVWDRARKISSYYSHGETLDTLSHEALTDPPSTVSTLSEEERAKLTYRPGGVVDSAIMMPGLQSGFFADLRRRAFSLPKVEDKADEELEDDTAIDRGDAWRDVEFRVVWCQMSHAEVSYIMFMLIAELEEAKEKGEAVRNVKIVRVKRGNHFVSACVWLSFVCIRPEGGSLMHCNLNRYSGTSPTWPCVHWLETRTLYERECIDIRICQRRWHI